MKVSDYIISFLVEKGVTTIFGYPGGCINHIIDSAYKNKKIEAKLNYHEQASAFAACGYAQYTNKLGVAYSTSGPGATNLITGIASAYFDYIPTLFITGQVDRDTEKDSNIRQKGFQETDIVACVSKITKWAYHISDPNEIKWCLEKAFYLAFNNTPGPILLDIPNDIQRMEINVNSLKGYKRRRALEFDEHEIINIIELLKKSKKPVFIIGNGIKQNKLNRIFIELVERVNVPVISSMSSFDVLPSNHYLNFGFMGTNGHRYANFITEKCDLIISFGNRLSIRPLGLNKELFAPNAKIIKIDNDYNQLNCNVHEDDINILGDLKSIIPFFLLNTKEMNHSLWVNTCNIIKNRLIDYDELYPNKIYKKISDIIPNEYIISADIGQNLVWLTHSINIKENQMVCMSTGNGPMGYSIPAGIGCYYGSKRPVVSFCGDGGFMMNLQELQLIKREKIPNKIVCMNNLSLGMIRAWQARYLDKCSQTTNDSGYLSPDLSIIAKAFSIKYTRIDKLSDLNDFRFEEGKSELIEIIIPTEIDTIPNGNMHDQNPKINRELYNYIMKI